MRIDKPLDSAPTRSGSRRVWRQGAGLALFVILALMPASRVLGLCIETQESEGKLIKEIRIGELRYTKEELVRGQMSSRVGEPYSAETRLRDVALLDRLRIFSRIEISPVLDGGAVIVDVTLEETLPFLPIVSIELTDENGVAAGPGVRSVNLLGRGIGLSFAAKFGGVTNLDFVLEGPWRPGRRLNWALRMFHRDRPNTLDGFEETSNDFDLRLGTNVGRNGRIGGRFGLYSVSSDVGGVTLSESNRDTLPSVGFFLGYDTRDRATDSRRGWWNELELAKRGGLLGGESDYWTLNADVRRYDSFSSKHTVMLSSLLTAQSGALGVDVPIHQDFHIGGTNSVRGHSLDSRRGKNQLLNIAEYRYRLFDPKSFRVFGLNFYVGMQAAAFVDWGFAWTDREAFSVGESIAGYGVGLRFLVPFVDMIRMDLAWGQSGTGVRFELGVFEKTVMQRERVR